MGRQYDEEMNGLHYMGSRGRDLFSIVEQYGLDFFEGNVVKYVIRHRRVEGEHDLAKARKYLTCVWRKDWLRAVLHRISGEFSIPVGAIESVFWGPGGAQCEPPKKRVIA